MLLGLLPMKKNLAQHLQQSSRAGPLAGSCPGTSARTKTSALSSCCPSYLAGGKGIQKEGFTQRRSLLLRPPPGQKSTIILAAVVYKQEARAAILNVD